MPRQRSLPQAAVHKSSAAGESQLGTCTPLVTWPTGTSRLRPARKEGLENPPADRAVQPADTKGRQRSAHRQIGHVERLFTIRAELARAPAVHVVQCRLR